MAYVNLIDIIYPVGSIYWTMNTTSPTTTLGGSWTQITRFPLPQATDTTAGQTGGSVYHQHHAELRWRAYYSAIASGSGGDGEQLYAIDWSTNEEYSSKTFGTKNRPGHWGVSSVNDALSGKYNSALATGSTTGTNTNCSLDVPTSYYSTMPPYITCYAWYRTS